MRPRKLVNPLKRPTLNTYFSTIFVSLFVVTAGGVAWYTYQAHTDAASQLSNQIIRQVSDSVVEKTLDHLGPLMDSAKMVSMHAARNPFDTHRTNLQDFLLDLVRVNPAYYSVYVGYEDGSFVQAYVVRVIDRRQEAASETWRFLRPDGRVLATVKSKAVMYDPRARPWYGGAKEGKTSHWTNLYVYYSLGEPGITASFPIADADRGFEGIAGADLTLGELSDFLADLRIGQTGIAFIMNARRQLVAFPDARRTVSREGETARPVLVDELEEVWLRTAVSNYTGTSPEQLVFNAQGTEYMASFTTLPPTFGRQWTIGVVVPAEEFVETVTETSIVTLVIAVAVLIAGIIVIGIVSKLVAQPIRLLADETRKIRDFDFDSEVKVRSRIAETHALTDSIATTKSAVQAFSKFVPRALVQQLIQTGEGVELGGKSRDVTIMFSDVRNFTTVSKKMPPSILMLHISEYFDELTQIILSWNGTIDKYIGDGIMAFWGAPVPDDDHPRHACHAVLEASARLEEINQKWIAVDKPPLFTRFGLHCGEAIVGNVGSSERMNYTAFGDAVNVASRLEEINKRYGTSICVSHGLHERVSDHFCLRPLDIVALKGRTEGVAIYELMAAGPEETGPMAAQGAFALAGESKKVSSIREPGLGRGNRDLRENSGDMARRPAVNYSDREVQKIPREPSWRFLAESLRSPIMRATTPYRARPASGG